jgi:hypothetical protein
MDSERSRGRTGPTSLGNVALLALRASRPAASIGSSQALRSNGAAYTVLLCGHMTACRSMWSGARITSASKDGIARRTSRGLGHLVRLADQIPQEPRRVERTVQRWDGRGARARGLTRWRRRPISPRKPPARRSARVPARVDRGGEGELARAVVSTLAGDGVGGTETPPRRRGLQMPPSVGVPCARGPAQIAANWAALVDRKGTNSGDKHRAEPSACAEHDHRPQR